MILHECLLYCSWFHCVRSRWNMPVYNVLRIMRPHLSEASRAKLHFGHFSIYLMSLSMSMSLSSLLNVTFSEMDPSGWFAGPCFVSVRLYHLLSLAIPNANWWTFAEMAAAKKDKLDHSCFSTWPKYFGEIAATGMIYIEGCRSVAKIIALVRRDDLQALELWQMTSVTSFEPLSTQLAPKVWGISKEKAFEIFWQLLNFHVSTSPSTEMFDKKYFKRYISYCHISNSRATTQKLCTNVVLSNVIPYLLNFIGFCKNMNDMIHWHWKQNRFQTSSRENLSLPLWKLVLSKFAMIWIQAAISPPKPSNCSALIGWDRSIIIYQNLWL